MPEIATTKPTITKLVDGGKLYFKGTRISIARIIGEFMISDGTAADAFVEYRNLCELGGFDASGPLAVADLIARVGAGEYRVSAYGFDPRGPRWEVFVRLGEEPS